MSPGAGVSTTGEDLDEDVALSARTLYRFFRAGEEETLALRGVSLSLRAGELVAVVGPSGSGKSTLLACLAGLDEPDGGTVMVGGRRISHQPETVRTRLRARMIGLVFQSGNLLEHLTVRQNIRLAQRLAARGRRDDADVLLELVGLSARGEAYPSRLSGGEATRAGLAVALAGDPAVVLADEPTGELDSATERQILDLLAERARSGVAVLVAGHSPAVAAAADRVIRLRDGQMV
ncbi:ABC transporter ATP-binding protein [Actinoallomurus purpureus]|uniref:ABC transporter ATP-binding protein n=1 Tax=Actinoallomurus purpureus TaxID=478114 RepID=UPI00209399FC|nr:ABC transporter ATP-binding protein [Actinoallomurus purpureus]MCO6003821.1 ABC transporter ATP-binding protein [Actinoallomurus purpureus]